MLNLQSRLESIQRSIIATPVAVTSRAANKLNTSTVTVSPYDLWMQQPKGKEVTQINMWDSDEDDGIWPLDGTPTKLV